MKQDGIVLLTLDDRDEVKSLWKENRGTMSIPYNEIVDRTLNTGSFYGIYENGRLVCMGGFQTMKRKPENRIIHLCVKKEKRRRGYGKRLVRYICEKIAELDNGKESVVYFVEGAENNGFWMKYVKDNPCRIEHDGMNTLRGVMDFNKTLKNGD